MANKTFIPAFRAKVGDWDYFICQMKYGEVARQVCFAYELGGNKDLSTMVQRGLSSRTEEIKSYLINSDHHFLGALIVAAWGGQPDYIPIQMNDPDGMLAGIDREFGVLTFDGTQQYFALDGQHRLRAIKDAVLAKPELLTEDICVLMIAHFDTEDGRMRTRRLFTNINRNAKVTTGAENIVLDEDDGLAIISRRFITDHTFFKRDGLVKVFTKQDSAGDITLAGGSVSKTDRKAFTTITVFYDMLRYFSFDLDVKIRQRDARPSPELLDDAYEVLAHRLDSLLKACGNLRQALLDASSARDIRSPRSNADLGHPLMRPIIQKSVARTVAHLLEQGSLNWDQAMERLASLEWKLGSAPWTSVYAPSAGRMLASKEFTELLDQLLIVHLAPPSKQAIKDARRKYKELRSENYPVSFEEFEKLVIENQA